VHRASLNTTAGYHQRVYETRIRGATLGATWHSAILYSLRHRPLLPAVITARLQSEQYRFTSSGPG
jgi:hypothetical protein